jgi:hypothetical protein
MPKQLKKVKKAGKAERPPLPEGHAKLGTLRVGETPDELLAIELAARREKQTVSEWIWSTLYDALWDEGTFIVATTE